MTSTQVENFFAALCECPPHQREARLAELEASNPALRLELESLLAVAEQAKGFLSRSPLPSDWANPDTKPKSTCFSGQLVGPYRLTRKLGQGGMGTVYLADRADGHYRLQVAIKLIRTDAHADLLVRRFRNERQILADFNHPYIARLLDGGSLTDGRPYLVMEYIQGEPIDAYCHNHELTLDDRLQLFIKVCQAVQYTHQRNVLHRDLKPGNILVTDEGIPKLLDFGIAKRLKPPPCDEQALTNTGQGPMTPDFASPEQLRQEDLTAATDVYALGLILYGLLTGQRPYQSVLARALREAEPPLPSSLAPAKWQQRLKGRLDAIVQRALAENPQNRYPSAQQLADDIIAYLEDQPSKSKGLSVSNPFAKFLSRHRLSVGMLGFLIVVMGIGAATVDVSERQVNTSTAIKPAAPAPRSQGTASVLDTQCAALHEQYRNQAEDRVLAQLVDCKLDQAEWRNNQGDFAAAMLALNELGALRDQYPGRPPRVIRKQKSRIRAAYRQAQAGIHDTQ